MQRKRREKEREREGRSGGSVAGGLCRLVLQFWVRQVASLRCCVVERNSFFFLSRRPNVTWAEVRGGEGRERHVVMLIKEVDLGCIHSCVKCSGRARKKGREREGKSLEKPLSEACG